jgi:YVTN family beta-propeller protein
MKKIITFLVVGLFLVMNGYGQTAYIPNRGSNNVSVINVATDSVIATIPVGGGPNCVTVSLDGSRVYVGNWDGFSVSEINTATNTVISTIPMGINPDYIVVHPDGTRIYVTNSTELIAKDVTTWVYVAIMNGTTTGSVAVNPDGSKVYVADEASNTIMVLNTTTNTISDTIIALCQPSAICVSPDGSKIYVASSSSSVVRVINTVTKSILATISGGLSGPTGICISPDGTKVYVSNGGNGNGNKVSVINTANNTISASIIVGQDPLGISITPDGSKVYVANGSSNTVSVINTLTDTVSATIHVGVNPVAIGNFISNYTMTTSIPSQTNPTPTISIYPNPFSTSATLIINGGVETPLMASLQTNSSLHIYNVLGEEVKTIPINNQKQITINKDNLVDGMYFYKLISDKNETVGVGKMVID